MNATKKTILLLSIISLNSSMFGMLDGIQKEISTRVLSQKRQVVTAVLIPLAAAGTFVLAQHKDDISSLLEKIPMPSEKVILGMATAAAMPATYVLLGKFSPEEQFQLHHRNYTEIKKHQIMQNKKMLQEFIANQKEAQLKEKKSITLLDFINNNFSDEVDTGLYSSIKVANQLCNLERRINVERQRLKQIEKAGTTWVVVEKAKDVHSSTTVSGAQAQLNEDTLFIQQLRGTIMDLPQYGKDKKIYVAIQKNKHMEQKINGSTLSSVVPMFIQPFMLLFQILLNRFGML